MAEKGSGKIRERIMVGYFIAAALLLAFFYGIAVHKYHIPPYAQIEMVHRALTGKRTNLETNARDNPEHPYHGRYRGTGVVVNVEEKTYPGATLMAGSWNDDGEVKMGFNLIGMDGEILHRWRFDMTDIWPSSPHTDRDAGKWFGPGNTHIHGSILLPDGSIVFNLDNFGMLKIDSESRTVWKLDMRTHHSIYVDQNGDYWVCCLRWHEERSDEFVGLEPPYIEDFILVLSPEGEPKKEISIMKSMYRSGYYGLLFAERQNYDLIHMNDVELLEGDRADRFEQFDRGDIMVSLRNINTLFVLDGESYDIKWAFTYPLIWQHDPDFTEDGYITVFDNQIERPSPDAPVGGSRILRIDPETSDYEIIYGGSDEQYFYTEIGGKHQHLPNGNILISEMWGDRVFEITPGGEVVWSWLAPRWDRFRQIAEKVWEASRYRFEYLEFIGKEE
jgi:hypothetical protein